MPSVLTDFQENCEPLRYPSFCLLAAKGHPDALRWEAYFPVMWPWPSHPGTGHLGAEETRSAVWAPRGPGGLSSKVEVTWLQEKPPLHSREQQQEEHLGECHLVAGGGIARRRGWSGRWGDRRWGPDVCTREQGCPQHGKKKSFLGASEVRGSAERTPLPDGITAFMVEEGRVKEKSQDGGARKRAFAGRVLRRPSNSLQPERI